MFDEFIKKCFPCGSLLTSISPTMVSKSSWQSSTWWTVMQLCSMHFKATVQAGFDQARVGFKSNKNPKSWHCHGSYRIRHNSLYRFWIATILTKSMQITGFKLERIFSGILFFSSILLQFFNDFFSSCLLFAQTWRKFCWIDNTQPSKRKMGPKSFFIKKSMTTRVCAKLQANLFKGVQRSKKSLFRSTKFY